ncbi:MAG: tetratricopeptide repeat protein [Bacteroidales bacterium]|nr:tetratricopeptide repeat protein [Bacteroidales bacterium]MCL2132753.1 tetratricopeptide repeat protein [Bacteroidales bacterium]
MAKQAHNSGEAVGQVLSSAEQFLTKYKNVIIYAVVGILAIVLIYFGYQKFYYEPQQEEARSQMFIAEQYYRIDSLSLALNGDGNNSGFLQIIDEYGSKAGDMVYFYAGICQLKLGQYEQAIENLKKYKVGDEITSAIALARIGDAYVNLNNYPEALNYFLKAANYRENIFAAEPLLKAGLTYKASGKPEEALKMFLRIKTNYPQSEEAREIDKYIGEVSPME